MNTWEADRDQPNGTAYGGAGGAAGGVSARQRSKPAVDWLDHCGIVAMHDSVDELACRVGERRSFRRDLSLESPYLPPYTTLKPKS